MEEHLTNFFGMFACPYRSSMSVESHGRAPLQVRLSISGIIVNSLKQLNCFCS
jgi:hypothetical protein